MAPDTIETAAHETTAWLQNSALVKKWVATWMVAITMTSFLRFIYDVIVMLWVVPYGILFCVLLMKLIFV